VVLCFENTVAKQDNDIPDGPETHASDQDLGANPILGYDPRSVANGMHHMLCYLSNSLYRLSQPPCATELGNMAGEGVDLCL
jgi:hypothetical protein